MKAIVIDTWSRALKTFVASVVREPEVAQFEQPGIHLRYGVEMGGLHELAAGGGPWREGRGFGSEELGLIILGSTYQAQSSAGFTDVITSGYDNGNAIVTAACGCLGAKSLRKIKPQKTWVWGPGKWLIYPLNTHGNSNCSTADAAIAGLKFLADSRNLVIVAEGQSDSVSAWAIGGKPEGFEGSGSSWTYGLKPLNAKWGRGLEKGSDYRMTREEWQELPVEHHQFTEKPKAENDQLAAEPEAAVAE